MRPVLRTGDAKIAAVNLAECYDKLTRTAEVTPAEIDLMIDALKGVQRLVVVALDERLARRAGVLRALHYDKRSRAVSLADCAAAATAEARDEPLVTADPHLAKMARDIGLQVIALPDSSGKRP